MSEQKVRKYVRHTKKCLRVRISHTARELFKTCTCGYEAAVAKDPDLVALLRKLYKWERGHRYESDKKHYGAMIMHIEKTVRLTADGWEWVEEGE